MIDEQFDADEILRDIDDKYIGDAETVEEETRELEFGNLHNENANFRDMASDLDTTEDLWES